MTGPLISVRDISKWFNGDTKEVLSGVSFDADHGDFVAIYGRSGCGKTTLLNIIGGLDRPSSGQVIIEGTSIVNLPEDQLARLRLEKIGFVFQDYNLLADLTVRENVALPLRFSRRKDGNRVDALLEEFGIGHIADDPANRISGGEAQRTAIARAMMNEPKILLADEPTGNLDRENAENVIRMFRSVIEEHATTVVLATHDQEIARHAMKTVLIEQGRAVLGDNDRLPQTQP